MNLKTPAYALLTALLLGACQDKTEAPAAPKADTAQTAPSADKSEAAENESEETEEAESETEGKGVAVNDPLLQEFADLTEKVRGELQNGKNVEKSYTRHRADVEKLVEKISTAKQDFLENYHDDANWQNDKPTAELRAQQKQLRAVGLEYWDLGEGMVEIRPVADYYVKLFGKAADKDLREFLKLEADDNKQLIYNDGALAVAWDDLANRIAAWENWAGEYPQSTFNKQVADTLKNYRRTYLFGEDNTPVAEDDGILLPEVEKEWTRFVQAHPNSETAQMVEEAKRYWKARQDKGGEEPDLSGYSAPFKNLRQYD
ncbi:hypothetical protein [Conchiformibius kuhniae]|uniref:Uncharacterized protein n=1 Tax=Conchiformibius kuhniae TaxID=211502 RepID=A0A8T9MXB1_9NEIS|nr:hypothetical protein [Conchiformibius kuhniae]UOP05505.1 hypothetical protein LVJ77_05070 [Conchiformibius kuhniae]